MPKKQAIIYGEKEDKSIKQGELVYDPVAGLTIKQAVIGAIITAKKAGKDVHAIINDVHMHISPDTSWKVVYSAYKEIADTHYQAALRACARTHSYSK